MSNRELKSIDLEFKEESEGKVSAVFSVFNNLDSDGDIVLPGAIESGFKSGSVPRYGLTSGTCQSEKEESKKTMEKQPSMVNFSWILIQGKKLIK